MASTGLPASRGTAAFKQAAAGFVVSVMAACSCSCQARHNMHMRKTTCCCKVGSLPRIMMSMLFFSKNSSKVPCTDWDCCSSANKPVTLSSLGKAHAAAGAGCCMKAQHMEVTAHKGAASGNRCGQRKVRAGLNAELWLVICCPFRPIKSRVWEARPAGVCVPVICSYYARHCPDQAGNTGAACHRFAALPPGRRKKVVHGRGLHRDAGGPHHTCAIWGTVQASRQLLNSSDHFQQAFVPPNHPLQRLQDVGLPSGPTLAQNFDTSGQEALFCTCCTATQPADTQQCAG